MRDFIGKNLKINSLGSVFIGVSLIFMNAIIVKCIKLMIGNTCER